MSIKMLKLSCGFFFNFGNVSCHLGGKLFGLNTQNTQGACECSGGKEKIQGLVLWKQFDGFLVPARKQKFSRSRPYNLDIFLLTWLGAWAWLLWRRKSVAGQPLFEHNFNCFKNLWIFAGIYPFTPCYDSRMSSSDFIIASLCALAWKHNLKKKKGKKRKLFDIFYVVCFTSVISRQSTPTC